MHQEPRTLGEVNMLLRRLRISAVSADCLREMQSYVGRDELVSVIHKAATDIRAKSQLLGLINRGNRPWGPDTESISSMLKTTVRAPVAPLKAIASSHEGNAGEKRDYLTYKAYGKKAALSFEADETRSGHLTVAIDGAKASAPRQYDWQNKVRVQLTLEELLEFAAVLYGLTDSVRFKNHGANHDKGFEFESQGSKFFGKVFQHGERDQLFAVPVVPADAFHVAMLCLRQLRRNYPWAENTDIVTGLRAVLARRLTAAVREAQ